MHHGQAKEVFFFVLQKTVIAGEEKTGYKTEDAVLKTGDRQAEDLCKVKQVQIRWKGCEEFGIFGWEVRSHVMQW